MSELRCHHADQWGAIFEHADAGVMEIRWYDTTADMETDDFNQFLTTFAGAIEQAGTTRCLVDATSFAMERGRMDGAWRDQHIIPRYNAAGVTRFAFHMPRGMPAIGSEPAPEGPARFPTGYFGTRAHALAWLAA